MNILHSYITTNAVKIALLTALAATTITQVGNAQETTPLLEVQSTYGKKVYSNVKVTAVTPEGVKIVHDAGISLLPANAFPKEWLEKHAPDALMTAPTNEKPETPNASVQNVSQSTGLSTSSFDPACLVFIKTDVGSGSGFIAKVNNKTYVYTNAHVLCGNVGGFTSKIVSIKNASGRSIPTPYELELSDMNDPNSDHGLEDVARFAVTLKDGESAYEISSSDSDVAMKEKIMAYGNSLGGDVMTSLNGEILGLGSDRLEISCEIVPGNSGGPVVLEKTKK